MVDEAYWRKAGKSKATIEADNIRQYIKKESSEKRITSIGSKEEEDTTLDAAIESAINWYQTCPYTAVILGKRDKKTRKQIRQNALFFVKRDLMKKNVATGFLSSLIISWVISTVAKWVVNKLLEYIFNQE